MKSGLQTDFFGRFFLKQKQIGFCVVATPLLENSLVPTSQSRAPLLRRRVAGSLFSHHSGATRIG